MHVIACYIDISFRLNGKQKLHVIAEVKHSALIHIYSEVGRNMDLSIWLVELIVAC